MSGKHTLTRAEIVRRRLEQEKAKRLRQATDRAFKPAPMVTSRSAGYVSVKHKRAPDKRRFNIALGMPDLHLHKPTLHLPRLRPGWRLASFFLTLALGAAIYLAWTLPYFHAVWGTVFGNERLTKEEINAVLGIAGQSIFTIKPDEVETRLRLNYPELASAEVKVYLPNYVFVTVTERTPVILWQQGEGYTWIDSSGVAFRPRGIVTGLVPVLGLAAPPAGPPSSGDPLSPPPYMAKEMVDAILMLAPNVPAGSMMMYDPRNGLGWNDSRGWQVFFGADAKDMTLKVRVYQSLVDSLMARGLYPEFISVVYPDAPYYRMAQPVVTSDGDE
jgi:hypothetical protein